LRQKKNVGVTSLDRRGSEPVRARPAKYKGAQDTVIGVFILSFILHRPCSWDAVIDVNITVAID
jgi:hypothetical protein